MNIMKSPSKILLSVVLLNIASTLLHYTDNALFVRDYPGPDWFTTAGVFATVAVMTPIGLLGYWLYTKSMFRSAYLLLGLYSITSISSPGHYLYPMVKPMSIKMHGLIWLDALSGMLLITFILWSSFIAQEWQAVQIED
jgi:hypothetical protein